MSTQPVKFYSKRQLNQDQQQRIKDHQPSVVVNDDGSFDVKSNRIITPKGIEKTNKRVSVIPKSGERIVPIADVPELFDELQHINLILTNACNLSCSYCYEQHNKDYGRFDPASLKQIYDFQLNCNDNDGKLFQFFGGEPLIHKQLILDFIDQYKEELHYNSNRIHVSMITNGILLTPQFIDQYFSHDFVNMSISLDTIEADKDHREIGQERIDHIIDMIELIPQYHKQNHMVSIRCTISIENAPYLKQFAQVLYDKGLRAMVIHPLTMSSVDGFLSWPKDKWYKLHQDIVWIIENMPNFEVQFSEGVGVKNDNNCMVGSDMIAVDGSGDYSGCYFFTNQKATASQTILGNIFNDQVYIDRYMNFQSSYDQMFIEEQQCKSCDLKGFCYQCPAGNMDSGKKMFRPDDMCQNIVRLFIDLQNDIVKKSFHSKLKELMDATKQFGEQIVFSKAITHLMYKEINGVHLPVGEVDEFIDKLPPYQQILGHFWKLIQQKHTGQEKSLPCSCNYVVDITDQELDVKTFYENVLRLQNKPVASSANKNIDDVAKRVFYLTLIHMIILNDKGNDLQKPKKIIKL